jgi:hypothetical protein
MFRLMLISTAKSWFRNLIAGLPTTIKSLSSTSTYVTA